MEWNPVTETLHRAVDATWNRSPDSWAWASVRITSPNTEATVVLGTGEAEPRPGGGPRQRSRPEGVAKGGIPMGAERRSKDAIEDAVSAAYHAWIEIDSPTDPEPGQIQNGVLRGRRWDTIEPPLSQPPSTRVVSWEEIQSVADEASDISAQVRAELEAIPRSVEDPPSAATVRSRLAPGHSAA